MTKAETVASKLRLAIQQIDSLPPGTGVIPEQLNFVRETLAAYLKQLEDAPESLPSSDLNRVSRLVVEYWPLSLPAGESVVVAEQALRKFAEKIRRK